MSVVSDTIMSALKSLIPGGLTFHPTYKILKVAPGQYDFTWGLGVGSYHLSLVLDGKTFSITGDSAVIPSDSMFPFNVIAQVVNGAFNDVLTGGLDSISENVVKQGLLTIPSHRAVNDILKAPVGTEIVVPEVK